jgi:NADPH2:quinone reductase
MANTATGETPMKAWLLDQFNGIDHVRLADLPDPAPGPGEVLMEMIFAALNPADRYLAEGQYPAHPPLPHILGRDGVGTALAIGANANEITVGEKYTLLRGDVGVERAGTFASRVIVPAESLVPVPPNWTLQQAACATLVYLTAYQALTQWGDLPPSTVLVTGASGGVGVASLQLGSAMGHTMIGLSRDLTKRNELAKLGATAAFDPHDPAWKKQLKAHLNGRRVDLAIDNIGGKQFSEVIETLGEWGKVSVVGRLAGPVPEFNTAALFFKRLRIGGVAVGSYTNLQSRTAWKKILAILDPSNARPLIDHIFPFDELPAAFARLAHGPLGKVLIRIKNA